jgi:DNA-directed RNA polymerase specialized sigma24 family protein
MSDETFPALASNFETEAIRKRLFQQPAAALPELQRRAVTLLNMREMTPKEAAIASGSRWRR